jgi:hypothetical protein
MRGPCLSRRRSLQLALGWAVLREGLARAEDVTVPLDLQVELLAKVAAYDRNFAARAGTEARCLIVRRPGVAESARVSTHVHKAIGGLSAIAGLPAVPVLVDWSGPAALKETIKAQRAAIAYLAPGLGDDVESIAAALDGVDVLSVAAIASYVAKGVVVGFDLVSGKPKLIVHLGQAKKQNVAFKAELLKMARVIE